jgi:hypothetical protein
MGKILFAIGMLEGWALYIPDLVRHAKESNSAIHVLEFAAPLGTGTFTSNMPPESEAYPEPAVPAKAQDEKNFDPSTMPLDTAQAALETTDFLEMVGNSLRANDLTVTTSWMPEFDLEQLPQYALTCCADTVALIEQGWWAKLLNGDVRPLLKSQGLTVIDLQESAPIDSTHESNRSASNETSSA